MDTMDTRSTPHRGIINTYCVVAGLTSPSGKPFNGCTCYVAKRDPDNADRVAVIFEHDIGSRDGRYVSLKPENLKPKFGVEVKPSTLGGLGVFATRDFAVGETILQERAFFVIPPGGKLFVCNLISRLSEPEAEVLSSLVCRSSQGGGVLQQEWPSRVDLNSIGDDDNNAALYPLMCRINHACNALTSNNVWWYSANSANKPRVLTALREIKKGDELLADYADLSMDASERKRALAFPYGISNCKCILCNPSLALSAAVREFDRYVVPIKNLSPLSGVEVPGGSVAFIRSSTSLARRALATFEAEFHAQIGLSEDTSALLSLECASRAPAPTCDAALHNLNIRLLRAVSEAFGGLLSDALHQMPYVDSDALKSLFSDYSAASREMMEYRLASLHGDASHPSFVAAKGHSDNDLRLFGSAVAKCIALSSGKH